MRTGTQDVIGSLWYGGWQLVNELKPVDIYTKLLLHADGTNEETNFIDASISKKTVTNTETYDSYTKLMLHNNGSDQGVSFTDSATAKAITNTETYDSYTSLMLHLDNNFTDSAKAKTITNVSGNVTFSGSVYKFATHSASFNGTNAYLTFPDAADMYFGSGNWTIDFWVKATNAQKSVLFMQPGTSWDAFIIVVRSDGVFEIAGQNNSGNIFSYSTTSGTSVLDGNQHHLAFVRSGDNLYIFLDGVSQVLTTVVSIAGKTLDDSALTWQLGQAYGFYYAGYLDEFRVNKGIARWISDFTPPRCSYGQVATVTGEKKFGTACAEFNGSGEYLTLADSVDWNFGSGLFTIDFWIYFNSFVGTPVPISNGDYASNDYFYLQISSTIANIYVKTGGVVLLNSSVAHGMTTGGWYHYSIVRGWGEDVNKIAMTVNGSAISNTTVSGSMPDSTGLFYIGKLIDGQELNGYMDEFRVSKGIAKWTATFTPYRSEYGTVATITADKKFGTACAEFKGSGECLTLADSADWYFGTGDFTIDLWFQSSAVSIGGCLVSQWSGGTFWYFDYQPGNGGLRLYATGGTPIDMIRTWTPTVGTWYHLALIRTGTTFRMFVNGTQIGIDYTSSTEMPDIASVLRIGLDDTGAVGYFSGYLDDIRVSKGIARWTTNFSVPITAIDGSDPITSYDITGLDGDTDEEYRLITRFVNGYNGAVNYKLKINGDTASNYGYQNIDGASTTAESTRGTSETGITLGACSALGYQSFGDSDLQAKSGYLRVLHNKYCSSVNGTDIAGVYFKGQVWNNSANNITSLTVLADQTNGIGIGSHLFLFKRRKTGATGTSGVPIASWNVQGLLNAGVFQLIERKEVIGSALTNYSFASLDGDTSELFLIKARVISGYAGASDARVQPNADSTAANYGNQTLYGSDTSNGAAHSTSYSATMRILDVNDTSVLGYGEVILYAKTGFARILLTVYGSNIDASIISSEDGRAYSWNNTTDNITSININTPQANTLGIGTILEIYGLRRPS